MQNYKPVAIRLNVELQMWMSHPRRVLAFAAMVGGGASASGLSVI
jgi:hypothetical protein